MTLFDYLFPHIGGYLSDPALFCALVLLGAGIGLITGLFGVGGGFLAVPMMNIVLGIPYEMAVGSSVCMIIGTGTSGVLKHRRLKNIHYPTVLNISIGSGIGVLLGDMLQDALAEMSLNPEVFGITMHGLFLVLLTGLSIFMLRSSAKHRHDEIPVETDPEARYVMLLFIGLLLGTLTGLLGISGGVLLIPILTTFFSFSPRKATGTSFGIVFISSIISIIKKGMSDVPKVSLLIVVGLLLSSVIGVHIGIKLNHKLNHKRFKLYFAYVLIGAAVLVAVDVVRKWVG